MTDYWARPGSSGQPDFEIELVVAGCDLDWCQRYQGTLFDFDRYRRPEVYTRITAQRGVIRPD